MSSDLNKAPEGTTHFYEQPSLHPQWYMHHEGKWFFWETFSGTNGSWELSSHLDIWFKQNLTPLPKKWTIYNNDKPLSELSNEQAAELFNWWCNSGEIECFHYGKGWYAAGHFWSKSRVYRAKQKSEKELFIEAADYFIDCGDDAATIAGKMFDAGFRAPKREGK